MIAQTSRPNFAPLERALGLAGLPIGSRCYFLWVCESPSGMNLYQHTRTHHYALLGPYSSLPICREQLKNAYSTQCVYGRALDSIVEVSA